MDKITGFDVERVSLEKIHNANLEFLIKYRDLLDAVENMHQNVSGLNLLEQNETITNLIEYSSEIVSTVSKFAPSLLKVSVLLDKIENLSKSE